MNFVKNLGLYATKGFQSGERNPSYNKRYAKYNINENFFDKQTPESLWVLGFIFADGSLRRDIGYRIELSQKEPGILQKINILMESNYPIKKKCNRGGWSNGDIYRLRMTSKKIFISLEKYGLHQNKSLDIEFPDLNKSILNHFIRGYFDGDGSIYKIKEDKRIVTKFCSGSLSFLKSLNEILFNFCDVNKKRVHYEAIVYYSEEAFKVLNFIYQGSKENTRLDRKYNLFNNWRTK